MKPLECIAARDAQHAVELLARYGASARVLAGGTDLLVDLKGGSRTAEVLVDLSRARDLKRLEVSEHGLVIGAMVTHGDLVRSPLVRELCPALAEAAASVGAVQTRNLGTIGGNLANAVPSMDIGPALVALDAHVIIAGPTGARRIPLGDLFVAPRTTSLRPAEMIVEISVPAAGFRKPMAFLKLGLRRAQALALVNVAAGFNIAGDAFRDARIALGAVAPTVVRATEAERYLEGRAIDAHAMTTAGALATAAAKPISDFRASAEYRRDMIAVLTRRALETAWRRA